MAASGDNVDSKIVTDITSKAGKLETVQAVSPSKEADYSDRITIDGKIFQEIKEGLAVMLVPVDTDESAKPNGKSAPPGRGTQVFYNPIQQFNRDLSVLAIKTFGESLNASRAVPGKKRKRKTNVSVKEEQKRKRNKKQDDSAVIEQIKAGDDGLSSKPQTLNGEQFLSNGEAEANHNEQPKDSLVDKTPSAYQPKTPFSILDALSATGLRALRYAHEIPFATKVVANDLSSEAVAAIKQNIKHNNLASKVVASHRNAVSHMYDLVARAGISKYEAIDLDPFGTAAPFLDAAVQALTDGGLLCVTCTDSGVFASTGYSEKTFALYGGLPLKGPHCHEAGLRLILHAIGASAARYGNAIEPLMSLSIDFYARVFVRVYKSPLDVKLFASRSMLVYNCGEGCGAWSVQQIGRYKTFPGRTDIKYSIAQGVNSNGCSQCGFKVHIAGPMYAGPLHSVPFVSALLSVVRKAPAETYRTLKRMEGMLTTVLEEALFATPPSDPPPEGLDPPAPSDDTTTQSPPQFPIPATPASSLDLHPFHFSPSSLSKTLHCQTPPEPALRGALLGLGYRIARSHTKPGSIKTNAPWPVIWHVMREWIRQRSSVKEGAVVEGRPGWKIMHPEDEEWAGREVVFDEKLGIQSTEAKKLCRYQVNPRPNWGPMTKEKGKVVKE